MRWRAKIAVAVGMVLVLLGLVSWLARPQRQPAPRLTFTGIATDAAGKSVMCFSITNVVTSPVLAAPILEIRTNGGDYERWAAGPPEVPATTLVGNGMSTWQTPVPDLGITWRVRLIWQPKPSRLDYAYANTLDGLLGAIHKADYPGGMRPRARVWHTFLITSESLLRNGAESADAVNEGTGQPQPKENPGP